MKCQWWQTKKPGTSQEPESRLLNVVLNGLIVGKVMAAWREHRSECACKCDVNVVNAQKPWAQRDVLGNQFIASNISSSNSTNKTSMFLKQYIDLWRRHLLEDCVCYMALSFHREGSLPTARRGALFRLLQPTDCRLLWLTATSPAKQPSTTQ